MIRDGILSLQVLDIPEVQQLIQLGPKYYGSPEIDFDEIFYIFRDQAES